MIDLYRAGYTCRNAGAITFVNLGFVHAGREPCI